MKAKICVMMLGLAVFSNGAFAATFTGNSKYTKQWCAGSECGDRPSFSDLEQLGIQRAAEMDAQSQCAGAGFAKCYTTSVQVTDCNNTEFDGGLLYVTCMGQAVADGEN